MDVPHKIPEETQGDVLHETMARYRITVKDLADAAGVSRTQVSRYRNNQKELIAKNLFALINALPDDARQYFLSRTVKGVEAPGNHTGR